MTPVLLLGLACALQIPAAVGATQVDPRLVRVHISTAEGGNPTELAARLESVKESSSAIGSKKKTLVLVDDEDKADVVIDVMDRGVTVPRVVIGIGPSTRPGQRPDPGAPPSRVVQLRVTVSLARIDEEIEIKNKNRAIESSPGWKSAADDIAKQVEKWVADRRAKILDAR